MTEPEPPRPIIDAATVDTYRRDGVVCIRGLLSAEEVDVARAGIDRVFAQPGPLALTASSADDPGRFVEDFCRWSDVEEIGRIALTSSAGRIAAELTGSRTIRLYHDHVLEKAAGTRQATPWHQDQPYYNVDGTTGISFWIPVDPVPKAACLEILAGTHAGPWLMPRTFLSGEAKWFPEGSLGEIPTIDRDRDADRLRAWDLEPGDAVAFHFLALHAAAGSTGRRRVLSLRYAGDDIVHAPRSWRTSPPFPDVAAELPAGAPLDHPRFPVVWPR